MAKTMHNPLITVITRPCAMCGQTGEVTVDQIGFHAWQHMGWSIQQALPEVPAHIREQIISGVHPACWDAMFAPVEGDTLDPKIVQTVYDSMGDDA